MLDLLGPNNQYCRNLGSEGSRSSGSIFRSLGASDWLRLGFPITHWKYRLRARNMIGGKTGKPITHLLSIVSEGGAIYRPVVYKDPETACGKPNTWAWGHAARRSNTSDLCHTSD